MYCIRKKIRFEMAHVLDSSYSEETGLFTCPVCNQENVKNIFSHLSMKQDNKHHMFYQEFKKQFQKNIDPLLPDYMMMEIVNYLKDTLSFMSENSIAAFLRQRAKELNLNTRKTMGKRRQGLNNPVHKEGVRDKISQTVTEQWAQGSYADRINGMLGRSGSKSPRYNKQLHTVEHQGKFNFRKFLKQFQKINICNDCQQKIDTDVHHIDENHDNYLPSNLEPLCVKCHMKNHQNSRKRPYVTIGKTFYFAGAHQLPRHTGLCQFLHGHEWKLEIKLRKRINSNGMVMDFSELKKIVNKYVINSLDHNTLNEFLYNPTAENLLVWIWGRLMFDGLLKGIYEISLWESRDSSAIINQTDMLSCINKLKIR